MEVYTQFLGRHATGTLLVLLGLMLLAAFLAPRLFNLVYRRLRPILDKLSRSLSARLSKVFPGAVKMVSEAYTARDYLGLYLVIGLGLSYFFLTGFSGLVEQLHESAAMHRFDQLVAQSYREHVSPAEVAFFKTVTILAGRGATYVLGILVGIVLLFRRERLLLGTWVIGLLGNSALNALLKVVFRRARPTLADPFLVEQNFSFPSGHAMGAVVNYGLLAYVMALLCPPLAARVTVLLTLLGGVAVGMSRFVLGVHFLSDVVAGWSIGLAWLSIVLTGSEFVRRLPSNANSVDGNEQRE